MEKLSDEIERLATIDNFPLHLGPDDRVVRCYEFVRKKVGKPPVFVAANGLVKAVKHGDRVIVSTGWIIPDHLPRGETDGAIGAGGLAHAISTGLGADVLMLGEEAMGPVLSAVCKAAGVRVVDAETLKRITYGAPVGTVLSFPIDEEKAKKEAKTVIDRFNPSAIITIEKAGRNEKNVWHTGFGSDFSASTAKVDFLIEEARERGILTIGIGDLGNEIGLGIMKDLTKEIVPYGAKCKCPCEAGIATIVETDVPIFTAVCDWGAYAIEAVLSALLKKPEVLHDAETERRIFEAAIDAGALEGLLMEPVLRSHGSSVDAHIHVIELMRNITEMRLHSLAKDYEHQYKVRP